MERQNNIFLNIGLKNCPIQVDEVVSRLNYNGLTVNDSMIKTSQYNGYKEKTLVIYSKCSYKFSKVIEIIENLCTVTNQDCIALKYNLNEVIVYNQFKNIKPIKFSNKYFKTLAQ